MVRVKRRYILLNISYKKHDHNKEPESDAFVKELRERIYQIYGDFGVACLNRGLSVKKYDSFGHMILCVRKGVHELVMSVTPLINTVARTPCSVTILHLSGTIRKCQRELTMHHIRNVRLTISKLKGSNPRVYTNSETFIAKETTEHKKQKKTNESKKKV